MPRFTGFARTYVYTSIFYLCANRSIYVFTRMSSTYVRFISHNHFAHLLCAVVHNTVPHPSQHRNDSAERKVAFSRKKNSFVSVVRFFNAIRLYTWIQRRTRSKTNCTEEFYNSCKVAFSVERSQWDKIHRLSLSLSSHSLFISLCRPSSPVPGTATDPSIRKFAVLSRGEFVHAGRARYARNPRDRASRCRIVSGSRGALVTLPVTWPSYLRDGANYGLGEVKHKIWRGNTWNCIRCLHCDLDPRV